jgi:RNA-directed DNA polymerase
LHPEKTKIVFCDQNGRKQLKETENKSFDFLGFTFRTRSVMTKDGKHFQGFSSSISKMAVKRIIKECYA